jgi:hypothetical protein
LALALSLNMAIALAGAIALLGRGETLGAALTSTAPGRLLSLSHDTMADSWRPMLAAYRLKAEDPSADLYALFFNDQVKFQYPPSALLFFDLVPPSLVSSLSLFAVALTVLASAFALKLGVDRLGEGDEDSRSWGRAALIALALLLGATYYPLIKAHELGQIQVVLDALAAMALVALLLRRSFWAGVAFGLGCLVKPQFAVLLIWSLMRRQWSFAAGFGSVVLAGLGVSVARFGLHDHARYLDVLWTISSRGEAYWTNQSVNGLLHRLLGNGDPVDFSSGAFPPYHPVVHAATIIAAVVILMLALWPSRRRQSGGDPVDLSVVLVAATIASPVAWEHHYGVLLPVFAMATPALIQRRPLGAATGPLYALSFVAAANVFVLPGRFFVHPALGLLASHVFFAGALLFALLLALRSVDSSQ